MKIPNQKLKSLFSINAIRLAVLLSMILPLGHLQAQVTANVAALPERLFDLPRSQFNRLVDDITNEATALETSERNVAALQRLNRILSLVSQIENYKIAMESLNYVDGNAVYADVTTAAKRLLDNGITTEKIAFRGVDLLVSFNDWSALTENEFEKREVILANFLAALREPALAVKANMDFARLFEASGHKSVAFDRYRDAIERSKFISATDVRNSFELDLAAQVSVLEDARKFGLMTMLLRGSSTEQQQQIVATIAKLVDMKNVETVVSNKPSSPEFSKLSHAWKFRLSMASGGQGASGLADVVRQHFDDIDTNSLVVLFSGNLGDARIKIVRELVADYLAKGLGIRALNLVTALPDDQFNVDNYLAIAVHFADQNYAQITQNTVAAIEGYLKLETTRSLTKGQQGILLTALVRSGDSVSLTREFENGIIFDSTFDKERVMLQSRIYASLNSADGMLAPLSDAGSSQINADLHVLAELINRRSPDKKLFAESSAPFDPDLWVKVGERLWTEQLRRQTVIEFVKSSAPLNWKLGLVKGAIGNSLFDPLQEEGKLLAEAILASGLEDRSDSDASLIAAALNRRIGSNFDKNSKAFASVDQYSARVSAFRGLAIARAQELDRNHWLDPLSMQLAGKVTLTPDTVLQTDVPAAVIDASVSLKPTDVSFLRLGAKMPQMPNFYVGSEDVYSRVPTPGHGEVGTTIGGESRIERLSRFTSEYYRDVSNLGVRDHIYLSNNSITPKFIFLRSGVLSMDQLLSRIAAFDSDLMAEDGGIVLLRAPIVVGPDATLVLSGEEFSELRLSKQKGALIINAGKIFFSDINITGYDEQTKAPATVLEGNSGKEFRPFILSWSGSQTFAANSKFEALGYPAGRAYGFSMSSGPVDDIFETSKPAAPTGLIVNNSFVNLYYGFYAFEANAVRLIGNEYRDGIVYGLDPHDRSRDLVMAFNSAYGTHKKHGIIISREVDNSYIVGNLSFDNAGSGIMLDRESTGTVIYANSLVSNKGDGFAAFESPCALVSNNYVEGNSRVGIKIRNSWDIQIEGNTVRKNGVSGIEAYIDRLENSKGSAGRNYEQDPYLPVSTLTVVRNHVEDNPAGLELHGVTAATIFGNRFVRQAPKLFVGDIDGLSIDILAKSKNSPITVTANCIPKISARKVCPLAQQGVILDHSSNRDFSGDTADGEYCLTKSDSVQSKALKHLN